MNLSDLELAGGGRCQLVHGDIRDKKFVDKLFVENQFDGVFHFAAESHVDRSILGPEAFAETNVLGTFRILEAARASWEGRFRSKNFRFIHVSTDEVYGSICKTGLFTESSPYDPSSTYSASKAASDHFVKAYFRTYDFPTLITNCSNNYGLYQFPEKLISLMILNIIDEKLLPVYGDGKNVRDWLYVIDHCDALLKVYENGNPGETYYIGGGAERENIPIVYHLCGLMDERLQRSGDHVGRRLIQFVSDRPGHDRRYAIDPSKIKRELGWEARHCFEDALAKTVDWYLPTWIGWIRCEAGNTGSGLIKITVDDINCWNGSGF